MSSRRKSSRLLTLPLNLTLPFNLPRPPLLPNPFADEMLDVGLAYEAVSLNYLIYRMDEWNVREILPEKYDLHLFSDTGSTEVMIVTTNSTNIEDGKIFVVFRGTDESPDGDWLVNLRSTKVKYGPPNEKIEATVESFDIFRRPTNYSVLVHQGFNDNVFKSNLYNTISSELYDLLNRTTDTGESYYNKIVHFCGHSLGGANAQLMGTYFALLNPDIKTVITTLGSPRQGNYGYKVLGESISNLRIWRMVLCRDIVPRVPNLGFYHVGHLIWLRCPPYIKEEESKVQSYYRQSGDISQLYADVPLSWIVNYNDPTLITDHFASTYLEWLQNATNDQQKYWTQSFQNIPPTPAPTPSLPRNSGVHDLNYKSYFLSVFISVILCLSWLL
eukprot:CAMPEP_0184867064 /NCGR_PEP_ID=MMETSP0580-20130426/24951_1 /TAXON_ID=1118495 /ORGANISM="Dactyliosolen fragilissimus" /LENGTH=386 /DNA_ID=CAMNT_0027367093 /DNA_START=421 /DNA_END=1581 /DNA_ORIENTATION=+